MYNKLKYIKLFEQFDHSDVDPYGEEDWEYDNLPPVLQIARNTDKPLDQIDEVKINPKSRFAYRVWGNEKGKIVKKYYPGWIVKWYDGYNDNIPYCCEDLLINLMDKEKKEKKKEKIRLKIIHIDPYGEENWLDEKVIYENSEIENENEEWIECPHDYEFDNGEEVKINPKSKFAYQVWGNRKGKIIEKNYVPNTWDVQWYNGYNNCYYWRRDLLINSITKEEWKKKKS